MATREMFPKMTFVTFLFASSSLVIHGCVPREFNEGDSEAQLVGGQAGRDGEFPGLLEIVEFSCTGAKIGPRHILTARHCTLPFAPGSQVRLRTSATDDPSRYKRNEVAKIWRYDEPNVSESRERDLNIDVAVVEMKRPLEGISMADLHSVAMNPQGQVATMVGFGCERRLPNESLAPGVSGGALTTSGSVSSRRAEPRAAGTQRQRNALKKRSCTVKTTGAPLTGTNAMCSVGGAAAHGSEELIPGLCPGDSGGPLYVNVGSAARPKYRIAGVNSNFIVSGDSRFARVDAGVARVHSWVKSKMGR